MTNLTACHERHTPHAWQSESCSRDSFITQTVFKSTLWKGSILVFISHLKKEKMALWIRSTRKLLILRS